MLGSGPDLGRLKEVAGPSVTWWGEVAFEPDWVRLVSTSVDLMVLPHTQGDPSGTYLEAAGLGVPVVGFGNVDVAESRAEGRVRRHHAQVDSERAGRPGGAARGRPGRAPSPRGRRGRLHAPPRVRADLRRTRVPPAPGRGGVGVKIIYPRPGVPSWHVITVMVRLLASLTESELVVPHVDDVRGRARRYAGLLPMRRGGEPLLVVAPEPVDLNAALHLAAWTKGYGPIVGWVIDSWWDDRIPACARRGLYDVIYVTEKESVEPWRAATGAEVRWLPQGTNALDWGSGGADRACDAAARRAATRRVGRRRGCGAGLPCERYDLPWTPALRRGRRRWNEGADGHDVRGAVQPRLQQPTRSPALHAPDPGVCHRAVDRRAGGRRGRRRHRPGVLRRRASCSGPERCSTSGQSTWAPASTSWPRPTCAGRRTWPPTITSWRSGASTGVGGSASSTSDLGVVREPLVDELDRLRARIDALASQPEMSRSSAAPLRRDVSLDRRADAGGRWRG